MQDLNSTHPIRGQQGVMSMGDRKSSKDFSTLDKLRTIDDPSIPIEQKADVFRKDPKAQLTTVDRAGLALAVGFSVSWGAEIIQMIAKVADSPKVAWIKLGASALGAVIGGTVVANASTKKAEDAIIAENVKLDEALKAYKAEQAV